MDLLLGTKPQDLDELFGRSESAGGIAGAVASIGQQPCHGHGIAVSKPQPGR
jgi:hypothetical protein